MALLIWLFVLIFFTSMASGLTVMPLIRKLAIRAGYCAIPNKRSSHNNPIPNIGGLAFFLSVPLVCLMFWDIARNEGPDLRIFYSYVVFLILGLMDDKDHISTLHKFMVQSLSIVLYLNFAHTYIEDFFGILHIYDPLPFYVTLFIMLAYTNAFNMIDGIDGLAAFCSLVCLLVLGSFFFFAGDFLPSAFAFSLSGLLIGFLKYNLKKNNKVMMGDTGSLMLGFTIVILVVRAYTIPSFITNMHLNWYNKYAFFSLLAYPLFDLSRVFILRLLNHRSPFKADRLHFHHLLIDQLKFTHLQASIWISTINLIIIGSSFLLSPYFSGMVFFAFYLFIFLLFSSAGLFIQMKRSPSSRMAQSKV